MQAALGKLVLVDLAGSERAGKTGAAGTQLTEGAQINKSLSKYTGEYTGDTPWCALLEACL
jgi:hypothetical protein